MTETNCSNGHSETINITLKNPKDADNSSKTMESTSYIIQLNEQLLGGNRELIIENNSLTKDLEKKDEELEEKDDEMGRVEKSNVYLKGLLKNFLEMSRLFQKISDNRKNISDDNLKYYENFQKEIKYIRYTLLSLYGLLIAISFIALPSYILFCVFLIYSSIPIGVIEYYVSIFKLPKHKKQEDIIKDGLKQIKELDASQDYIHEFIDQV